MSYEMEKLRQKHEGGVLRADACMERHDISREDELDMRSDDLYGKSEYRAEYRLFGAVHTLRSMGYKLEAGQSIEEFVAKHEEVLA